MNKIEMIDRCILFLQSDREEWLMVTGGDDNSVLFCTFTLSLDETGRAHFTPLLKQDLPNAHSAQVTGKLLPSKVPNTCYN